MTKNKHCIGDATQTSSWQCLSPQSSLPVSFSSSFCVRVCVCGGVVFIYAVSVSHLNYRGRLTLCYQGSFQSNASSECVSALSHHPVCLIYGLTQMSSAERNRAFI